MLPINPFKKLAKDNGAKRISDKAVKRLVELCELCAKELVAGGIEAMKNEDRRRSTLLPRDLELAAKLRKVI